MLMNKVNGQQDCDKQQNKESLQSTSTVVTTKATSPDSNKQQQQQQQQQFYTNLQNNMQFIKKQQETNSSLNNMDSRTVIPPSGSNSSASSTTSSGPTSNDNYQLKTTDINNNNTTNTHSSLGQLQQQLSQQNNLANAYSMLNNPYLNGAMLNNSSQSNQNNLLASLAGQAYNGFNFPTLNNGIQNSQFANPTLHGLNSTSALTNQATPSHHEAVWHTEGAPHSQFMSNLANTPGFIQNSTTTGVNLNDEHQVYEYLHQLLEEKEKLKELFNEPFNIMLPISAKLLDEEVSRIRVNLFQLGGKESVMLPEPVGQVIQMTEKLYVPVKDHPEFNFVGRILGPRGMTAKQLEQETGCKIMVRGKGSMRDKAKEDQMKGKPNWEHLSDELHVLLTVEDTKNRCEVKLKRAAEEIKRLLVPAAEGEDELKKKQLMELAIINGTYRDGSKIQQNKMNQILIPQHGGNAGLAVTSNSNIRSPPNQVGQPLIISPRLQPNSQMINGTNSQPQQFFTNSNDPSAQLIYATLPTLYSEQHNQLLNPQTLLEYPNGIELSQAGSIKPQRFSTVGAPPMRAHPYARVI